MGNSVWQRLTTAFNVVSIVTLSAGLATLAYGNPTAWPDSNQGPGPGPWQTATPETQGLSSVKLNAVAAAVSQIAGRQGLVVIRNGTLVFEQYWANVYQTAELSHRNVSFSAAKSWGSAMLGRAVTQGLVTVDDKVADYHPPSASGLRPGTTLRHLLTMSSGGTLLHKPSSARPLPLAQRGMVVRHRGAGYQHAAKAEAGTPSGYGVSLQPGVMFYYDGEPADHLSNVIAAAAGQPSHEYVWRQLLEPLGVKNFNYQPEGIDPWANIRVGGSIELSVRDLARLGQLWLNRGRWADEQLIDAKYVTASVTPSAHNPNYGFLWWLGGRLQNAAEGMFFASGAFGQLLFVLPDQNMVIATMGFSGEPRPVAPAQAIWDAVRPLLAHGKDTHVE